MMISITLLTGCVGVDQKTIAQGSQSDMEEEYINISSDLIVELKKIGVTFEKEDGEDSPIVPASYEDEYGRVRFLLEDLISLDDRRINKIFIDSQLDLSQHPVVQVVADTIGDEEILTWLANQEKRVIQTNQEETIQELLVLDRNYLFFEYLPGSEIRTLEIEWSVKPKVPMDFEDIANQLEEHGLLITGYIEGMGGQTLIATNPDYCFLEKRKYQNREMDTDRGQAATYKVMRDTSNNYSVQLYGYMGADLSYKTKVENMPGLDEIIELMKMDQEDFTTITEKVNVELSEARELLNDNLQREYYLEGGVGEYHYTVMVPEGIGIYNFTVLIERK